MKTLPHAVKGFTSRCKLQKGSIVLVREDNVPRLHWPLGVVTDLFPGKDGLVRSVNVKTSKGVICRSVQRLHDLEICDSPEVDECVSEGGLDEVEPENKVPVSVIPFANNGPNSEFVPKCPVSYSRRGRMIKVPERLDL